MRKKIAFFTFLGEIVFMKCLNVGVSNVGVRPFDDDDAGLLLHDLRHRHLEPLWGVAQLLLGLLPPPLPLLLLP